MGREECDRCIVDVVMVVAQTVLSAFFHASWNALVKREGKQRAGSILTLTGSLLFTLVAALFRWNERPNDLAAWPWLLCAGLGETAYVIALGIAYSKGDLGVTYAISRGVALVVIWPLSWLCFASVPNVMALGGTVLVGLGIVFISDLWHKRSGAARLALVPTVLSGCAVGVYHTGYKGCVAAGYSPVWTFLLSLFVAVPLLWIVQFRAIKSDAKALLQKSVTIWLLSGFFSAASFLLAIDALRTVNSGVVLAIRNTSIGFGLLFSLWAGERLSPRQWCGVALLAGAIACFGWA